VFSSLFETTPVVEGSLVILSKEAAIRLKAFTTETQNHKTKTMGAIKMISDTKKASPCITLFLLYGA
jgi:hypothetical protein